MLRYPFDTAKRTVQSKPADEVGVVRTLVTIGERWGMVGLWKGYPSELFKIPSLWLQTSIIKCTKTGFLWMNGYIPAIY